MKKNVAILVFYQNLRLHDQPLLQVAAANNETIVPLFINDPQIISQIGAASQWWLYQSLLKFAETWQEKFKQKFIFRTGNSLSVLSTLVQETQAAAIYFGIRYAPIERNIDDKIKNHFNLQGVKVHALNTHLLFCPLAIKTQQGSFFRVYTPFWQNCLKKWHIENNSSNQLDNTIPALTFLKHNLPSDCPQTWQWGHSHEKWASKLSMHWEPSESNALQTFNDFISTKLAGYDEKRNSIAMPPFTSLLSPYLRWGQISVQKVAQGIQQLSTIPNTPVTTIEKDKIAFLQEIGWREFSYYIQFHYPNLGTQPFKNKFRNFPWQNDNLNYFECWKHGTTGYPIIDAGMRQLWLEGWMPNRLRMIVASFLTKDLLINWQLGKAWFDDTLVDADPASNANNWQWVAGCGVDAAPYFRIFNPIQQSEKFDPQGDYIRQYIPELHQVPTPYIHQPWKIPLNLQQKWCCQIGKDYPMPVVDHALQRQKALAAWKKLS